jgi:hypothetical protein
MYASQFIDENAEGRSSLYSSVIAMFTEALLRNSLSKSITVCLGLPVGHVVKDPNK